MVPLAHISPHPKWPPDRFIRFCRANRGAQLTDRRITERATAVATARIQHCAPKSITFLSECYLVINNLHCLGCKSVVCVRACVCVCVFTTSTVKLWPSQNALVLRIAGHGLLNPVDVGRDASDDRLPSVRKPEAVDTDECPSVLMVFARERASAVTLHATLAVLLNTNVSS